MDGHCGQKVNRQANHGMREIQRSGQDGFFSAPDYCALPQQRSETEDLRAQSGVFGVDDLWLIGHRIYAVTSIQVESSFHRGRRHWGGGGGGTRISG